MAVLDKATERTLHHRRSIELPFDLPDLLADPDATVPLVLESLALTDGYSLRSFTVVARSLDDTAAPRVLATRPIPTFAVSDWLAVAHAVRPEFTQYMLVDTTMPGRALLLRREEDGAVRPLRKNCSDLRSLLDLPVPNAEAGARDVLLLHLAESCGLVEDTEQCGVPLSERLRSSLISHWEETIELLARLLRPLADSLAALQAVADCQAVAFVGESASVLSSIIPIALERACAARGHQKRTPIQFVNGSAARHIGALRATMPLTTAPGVWSAQGSGTAHFQLVSSTRVSYSVVHPASYAFDLGEDAVADFVGDRPILAAIDKTVDRLYGETIREYLRVRIDTREIVLVDSAEASKTWNQLERVCAAAIAAKLPRDSVIVAIGGGVTLDLVGLAASLYRRGVPYLRVPTTLVGLVDVGVGVKQAVNYGAQKNILGAFYPALGSVNDATFLATLSERDIACGLAEIIKMGLVCDRNLFELVETHARELLDSRCRSPEDVAAEVLSRAAQSMMEQLQPNLFERDLQRLVDFGHSFSPTMEALSEYTIPHGHAVAMDMILCTFLAVQRRMCSVEVFERLCRLYRTINLPITQAVASVDELVAALDGVRAHRGGRLNLVFPEGIGKGVFVQEVRYAELSAALHSLAQFSRLASEGRA